MEMWLSVLHTGSVDTTVQHPATHDQGYIAQKCCFDKLGETVTKHRKMFSGCRDPDALEFIRVSDQKNGDYVNVSGHTA